MLCCAATTTPRPSTAGRCCIRSVRCLFVFAAHRCCAAIPYHETVLKRYAFAARDLQYLPATEWSVVVCVCALLSCSVRCCRNVGIVLQDSQPEKYLQFVNTGQPQHKFIAQCCVHCALLCRSHPRAAVFARRSARVHDGQGTRSALVVVACLFICLCVVFSVARLANQALRR